MTGDLFKAPASEAARADPAAGDILRDLHALRPFGGFDLIMADPPWAYVMRSEKGYERAPQAHYECASVDDIAAVPVEAVAGRDCLLWLWALNPMLPQALEVMAAWGFTFKTGGAWIKRTAHGRDAFGAGYLLRGSSEPFLIGTRGAPKVTRSTRSTVASYPGEIGGLDGWPAVTITIEAILREHSRKPEEGFAAAEALMPDAKRLELFSRASRPGWRSWGKEAGKFDAGAT